METLKVPGTGKRPRPRQIGGGDGGASPILANPSRGRGLSRERPQFWQIGDGDSVTVGTRSVPVLGQIGDGDGNGDRGVRALLGGLAIRDLSYHL